MAKTFRNKFIFVDCDGTLTNSANHVSEVTKQSIRNAQALGHKVFLCTGRSEAEIDDTILNCHLDGIIGSSGAYLIIDNRKVFHHYIDQQLLIQLMLWLDDHDIYYYLESSQGMYASKEYLDELSHQIDPKLLENYPEFEPFFTMFQPIDKADLNYISKISYCHSQYDHNYIQQHIDSQFRVYEDSFGHRKDSGEIGLAIVNKATAIDEVLNYYHNPDCDIIAIGDGDNDIDMLQKADLSIAMGNASQPVKDIADKLTLDNDHDGLAHALNKLLD